MSAFSFILVIAFIAITAWSAWGARTSSHGAATLLLSFAITAAVNACIGALTPWYSSVPIAWWYALIAATALYAGAVVFNLAARRNKSADM